MRAIKVFAYLGCSRDDLRLSQGLRQGLKSLLRTYLPIKVGVVDY
jgi:hypothetical protein